MKQFQGLWMTLVEVDPGNSGVEDLLKELFEGCPPLMINIALRQQTTLESFFKNTNTQINVFAKPEVGKPSSLLVHLTRKPHVEASGVKFLYRFGIASDTTCGK